MNEQQPNTTEFNRRDFLKGGSLATVMALLGGVELVAQTPPPADNKPAGPKTKVAVIGLGVWGREILTSLTRVPQAEVAAVCDTYKAMVNRSATIAPGAAQTDDYKTLLANPEIKAVVVATPTHLHKEVVLAALKAKKHVYCEAPIAHTMEDAKEIALAAKNTVDCVFQAGFQLRSDPQRHFLLPFVRSGALGTISMARAQWQKKTSWRFTSPNPEREKALNWRLEKASSLGIIGELSGHQVDQASFFLAGRPVSVTGFGTLAFWKDGREVPDTVEAVIEYPNGVRMMYQGTLCNSFEGSYEIFYGSDAAVMLRESKAWMFKEVDSPLLGWEVYATKETFGKETGIVLRAGASKAVPADASASSEAQITSTPLYYALQNFVRNCADVSAKAEDFKAMVGDDDPKALAEELSKVARRPSAGYLEGYQTTVTLIKANEAILTGQKIQLKPEWYELA
jgi:predicted dehydrogenase